MDEKQSLEDFILENGLEEFIDELQSLYSAEKEVHELSNSMNVEEDELFEFIWKFNERIDYIFPILDFNYVEVERTANQIIKDNGGEIEWGELIDEVHEETGVEYEDLTLVLGDLVVIGDEGSNPESDVVVSLEREI